MSAVVVAGETFDTHVPFLIVGAGAESQNFAPYLDAQTADLKAAECLLTTLS
jgi:hypothetical protein